MVSELGVHGTKIQISRSKFSSSNPFVIFFNFQGCFQILKCNSWPVDSKVIIQIVTFWSSIQSYSMSSSGLVSCLRCCLLSLEISRRLWGSVQPASMFECTPVPNFVTALSLPADLVVSIITSATKDYKIFLPSPSLTSFQRHCCSLLTLRCGRSALWMVHMVFFKTFALWTHTVLKSPVGRPFGLLPRIKIFGWFQSSPVYQSPMRLYQTLWSGFLSRSQGLNSKVVPAFKKKNS